MGGSAGSSWEALLVQLAATPRENGSAQLHQTAGFLLEALQAAGANAELVPFVAHPYGLRLAGVTALVGSLLFLRAVRARRGGRALLLAVLVPGVLLANLDHYVPIFSWIGAQTQHHVVARLEPHLEPTQTLILSAHYDTKTDALDHVERAPVDRLAAPVTGLMIVGALALLAAGRFRRRERLARCVAALSAWVAAAYGLAVFTALSAGAFLPKRSPGALDDGAACAVLVRLAERLVSDGPLERTRVEILLLSAEEVGVQGSRVYAGERFATPPALPTFVVNLEGLGASSELGVYGGERFTLRSFEPDPRIVRLLDQLYRDRTGRPIHVTRFGAATDARSFLARGVPAATLFSLEGGSPHSRDLHSHRDDRSRLDEAALDETLGFLAAAVRTADARGIR